MAYSKGLGRLTCVMKGYEPCHNAGEVIAQAAYDPELDVEHTPDSVFCSHGAGVIVSWDQVRAHMHLDSGWRPAGAQPAQEAAPVRREAMSYESRAALDKELEAIFERAYGPVKSHAFRPVQKSAAPKPKPWKGLKARNGEDYLLVDGYNIIHGVDELRALGGVPLRESLRWATLGGAEALGLDDALGTVAPGKRPGLNLLTGLDFERMALTPDTRVKPLL